VLLTLPDFLTLNVFRTRNGTYQASVTRDGTGWQVATGTTPDEALRDLFATEPREVPPCPV
jgi:hypothetical protein